VYTDAGDYVGRTWSLWLAASSFLYSPFWFNPLTFDWNVVTNDYDLWFKWIRGTSGGASKCWSMWYNEENAYYKGLPLMSKTLYFIKAAVYLLVAQGIKRSSLFKADITLNEPTIGVGTITVLIVVILLFGKIFSTKGRAVPYPVRRTIGIMLFLGLVICVVTLFIEDANYIRYALAGYYAAGAVCLCGLLCGVKIVKQLYLVHDIVCAHLIFIPLFLLAALQLPGLIQTWLLYHNALSTDVVVSDILRYARRSQESGAGGEVSEDVLEQISELKRLVQKQEQALLNAGLLSGNRTLTTSVSSGSVADLLASSGNEPQVRADVGMPVRAFSMSGLDVWGNMALGDVQTEDFRQSTNTAMDNMSNSLNSVQPTAADGFSFTQPDTMPPR
jgi:callose synthase